MSPRTMKKCLLIASPLTISSTSSMWSVAWIPHRYWTIGEADLGGISGTGIRGSRTADHLETEERDVTGLAGQTSSGTEGDGETTTRATGRGNLTTRHMGNRTATTPTTRGPDKTTTKADLTGSVRKQLMGLLFVPSSHLGLRFIVLRFWNYLGHLDAAIGECWTICCEISYMK